MDVAFIASRAPEAEESAQALRELYGLVAPQDAEVIVALGGDGFMLQTMHDHIASGKPIYGMNRGSVGFLMNEYSEEDLPDRLKKATVEQIHPLSMTARDRSDSMHRALAFNEVSLFRQTYQAAKLEISIDGTVRLEELICDGVLIATPAGSTAYNLSAQGPILPINSPLLALTPLSPFRPRRWRGAILPHEAKVHIVVLEGDKRPVSAVADHNEFRDVTDVTVEEDQSVAVNILFDEGHSLEERVLSEQFLY